LYNMTNNQIAVLIIFITLVALIIWKWDTLRPYLDSNWGKITVWIHSPASGKTIPAKEISPDKEVPLPSTTWVTSTGKILLANSTDSDDIISSAKDYGVVADAAACGAAALKDKNTVYVWFKDGKLKGRCYAAAKVAATRASDLADSAVYQ